MNVKLLSRNQEAMQTAQAAIHNTHAEMQQDIRILLRSQVSMSDALQKLAEAQRQTDRRMEALILTVDEIIRGRNGGPRA